MSICADLGLSSVSIQTSLRLGRKYDDKTRPLKVILTDKAQRKFILDNAKNIPLKVRSNFSNVIISKDLTPQQREEKRKQIIRKREQRGLPQQQGQSTHVKRFERPLNRNPVPNTNTNRPPNLRHEQPRSSGSNNHNNSGGIKSPTFHSTLILRPSSSNSPPIMEVDSHISPITSASSLSNLNMHNVTPQNDTVIEAPNEYESSTVIDVENHDTVIRGTQVSYHEESESPNQHR